MTTRRLQSPHARGQALVEFTVAAVFFLLPLLLATVALGKLANVRHTAALAARYAAWERTVWYDAGMGDAGDRFGDRFGNINGANRKSAAQIRSEIAVRLINDRTSATVIRASDRAATGYANGSDPLWRDNEGRAYLNGVDRLTAAQAWRAPGSGSDAVTGAGGAALAALQLPDDTLAVADVALRGIAGASQAYQRLWPRATVWLADWDGLDFAATGAILSNTWAANGAGATAQMVAAAVPTAQGLGARVGAGVETVLKAWDPGAPAIEFGKIAPDVVPSDRLRP